MKSILTVFSLVAIMGAHSAHAVIEGGGSLRKFFSGDERTAVQIRDDEAQMRARIDQQQRTNDRHFALKSEFLNCFKANADSSTKPPVKECSIVIEKALESRNLSDSEISLALDQAISEYRVHKARKMRTREATMELIQGSAMKSR